jgi:SAM-dependent methyltransferase
MPTFQRTIDFSVLVLAAAVGSAAFTAVSAQPVSSSSAALPGPTYQMLPGSPDGIGKRFMGREIAGVMGFEGAAWLERVERDREERSDLLIQELALQPGLVVADVGAGSGYYSRRIAAAVGPAGQVMAVDVQPEMLALLQKTARLPGGGQITPVLATAQDVRLAPGSVDIAVMVDVYHELAFPLEVMQSVVRSLKPGGRVVFVEYRAEDPAVPIKRLHKMSEVQIKREAALHPQLVWERTASTLPWQHMVVFRKK